MKYGRQPQIFENGRRPEFFLNGRPQVFDNGIQPQFFENGRRPQFILKRKTTIINVNQQHSTGNLTNTTTKNILAQRKKSTLIGYDIIVN